MSAPAVGASSAPQRAVRRPLRVLRLRDSPWVDGPGRTIIETSAHIDPARVEFTIGLLTAAGKADHPMIAACQTRQLRHVVIEDRGGVDRNAIAHLRQLIRTLDLDILHTSDIRTNLLALFAVGFARRPLLVATAHGWIANDLRRKLMRALDKIVLRRYRTIVLVSRAMQALLPRWWIPRSKLRVIHNALVIERYGRELSRPSQQLDGLRLLNVGRLSPEKGQALLIEAVARLAADIPGLRLAFAGVGPLESELRALAVRRGVADRVEFLGYVDDMPAQYARSHVVVQSSLTEGMPNVILEAGLLGVPVIATQVGGTDEVIVHEQSGQLIRPGSVEELTAAIAAFARAPARYAELARAAHQKVREEFSFDARTEKLTRLYEELCGPS